MAEQAGARYQRRLPELNESISAAYLSGANTRRLNLALKPLLKEAPLSKSAVSRVVQTLKAGLAEWKQRPLASDALVNVDTNRYSVPAEYVARFPFKRSVEQFDFAAQPSIDPRVVAELCGCRFISSVENVLLMGPPGVGKTHLAVAIGMKAIAAGHSTLFLTGPRG